MKLEDFMQPITSAARVVRASLPPHHGLELADLVSIGAERVLLYLARAETTSSTLVFICAKQGMLYEARRWVGRDPHGRARKMPDPKFEEFDHVLEWRRSHPAPPMELLIDCKRALLSVRLREAAAWYSSNWLGETHEHLEAELGVSAGRVRQYAATATAALRAVADATPRANTSQTTRVLRRRTGARERYNELRRLGATSQQARSNLTPTRFAGMVRQLTAEAAE